MIDRKDRMSYLWSLTSDHINSKDIFNLFNRPLIKDPSGNTIVGQPLFFPTDPLVVEKGKLPNVKETVTSTVGRYIFNLVTLAYAYGDKIDYVNKPITSKVLDGLQTQMADLLLMHEITVQQFGKWQTSVCWLNNFSEVLVPGQTVNMLLLPMPIKKELQRLIKENKDVILKNDAVAYVNLIEKPILKFAKEYFIETQDPGWQLYCHGKKPKFENAFKNMYLEIGPVYDIATGKFDIINASFADGIDKEKYTTYASSAVFGNYNRGVATQDAGAKTKHFTVAFQSLVVTEEDCGTTKFLKMTITDKNKSNLKWRWIKNGDSLKLVTPDILDSFVGKTVYARTPLYCKTPNGCLCWKCAGDIYRRLGIKNVGLTLNRLTSDFLQVALKKMHDVTVNTTVVDWKKRLYKITGI